MVEGKMRGFGRALERGFGVEGIHLIYDTDALGSLKVDLKLQVKSDGNIRTREIV